MLIVALLWIVVGLALWVHYKLTVVQDDSEGPPIGAPPQSTFIGAMMWPFYLGGFLLDKVSRLFGFKSKE